MSLNTHTFGSVSSYSAQPITVFVTDKRTGTQDSCEIVVPIVQKIGPATNAHHFKVSTEAVITALESKGKISGMC